MSNRRAKWGWGTQIAIAGLLIANGLALPFIVANDGTFEDDTGHARADVERDYPGVLDQLDGRAMTIGVLLVAFAAMMLATGINGLRTGAPGAWINMWVADGSLLAIGVYFIAVAGRVDIAAQYLLFGAIGVGAQFLIRPSLAGNGETAATPAP